MSEFIDVWKDGFHGPWTVSLCDEEFGEVEMYGADDNFNRAWEMGQRCAEAAGGLPMRATSVNGEVIKREGWPEK